MSDKDFHHRQPAWYLRNPHLQTFYGDAKSLLQPTAEHTWSTVSLPDGDFLELAESPCAGKPVLLLVTGLAGSVRSHYAQEILRRWQGRYHIIIMHYRGFGRMLNKTAKAFHAGEVHDIAAVVAACKQAYPQVPLFALGISIGGSILLNALAQYSSLPIDKAVAVSVPYDTQAAAVTIPKVYDYYLLSALKRYTRNKMHRGIAYPVTEKELLALSSVYAFDDALTAPVYGFASAEDYYAKSSVRARLPDIAVPTLLISGRDDPFMPPSVLPEDSELATNMQSNFTDWGGHVGFHLSWRQSYLFLEQANSFFNNN